MSLRKTFRGLWIGGLILFAIVLGLHAPLVLTAVPNGILDHQAAGKAAEINRIHAEWSANGLLRQAKIAMVGDLLFIGIYGLGSLLGGWYYYVTGRGIVRSIGLIVIVCALVFLVTDYGETGAQLFQIMREKGGNKLAAFAAILQPAKIISWTGTFAGIIAAFAVRRIQRKGRSSAA